MKNNRMEKRLKIGLTKTITDCEQNNYLWLGVMECKTARKYKYEVYWFNRADHYWHEDDLEEQYQHADSRMCTSLAEAYAYGFDAIRDYLQEDSSIQIIISDTVEEDREEE